ncbi:hypothetical protein D3C80_1738670 [compost metagenome]
MHWNFRKVVLPILPPEFVPELGIVLIDQMPEAHGINIVFGQNSIVGGLHQLHSLGFRFLGKIVHCLGCTDVHLARHILHIGGGLDFNVNVRLAVNDLHLAIS